MNLNAQYSSPHCFHLDNMLSGGRFFGSCYLPEFSGKKCFDVLPAIQPLIDLHSQMPNRESRRLPRFDNLSPKKKSNKN